MGKFFLYGGNSGTSSILNTKGTELTISYGEDIDGITNNGTSYGGKGKHSQTVTMPADSVFQIVEMQTHANKYWGYLKLLFGDQVIEAGQKKKGEVVFSFEENDPLPVKISSINAGTRIDGIEFILV